MSYLPELKLKTPQRGAVGTWVAGGLVAIMVFSCIASESRQREERVRAEQERATAERQAKEARELRQQEFARDSAAIIAEAEKLLAAGQPDAAINRIGPYIGIKDQKLEDLHRRALIALHEQKLAKLKPDDYAGRADAYRTLARLAPDVKRYETQAAAMDKKAEAKIKAARRKEGVRIGMSKQEVLDSSWGRPEHINATHYSFGDREQWVYGGGNYLYFENGILTTVQTGR